ncbi:FMRFamide receptor [Biomphalaria glabrata]|nr:FMRFamide receptor-like [Biomphalaria glabrata]
MSTNTMSYSSTNLTHLSSSDNDQTDIVTTFQFRLANLVINCVLINIICLLGLYSNLLNLIILSQHSFKSSTNILLVSLSSCDLAYVMTTILRRSSCILSLLDEAAALTMEAIQSAFFLSLNTVFKKISSGHILLISLERLVAVYSPLQVSRLFSAKSTGSCLILLTLFWISLVFPLFVPLFRFDWVYDSNLNRTVGFVTFSEYVLENWDVFSILNIVNDWLKGPVQFIVITWASACTLMRLADYDRKRVTMGSLNRLLDVRVAKMLLVVCLAYLLTSCPTMISTILYLLREDLMSSSGGQSRLADLMEMLNDLLGTIGSSINFFIYIKMSTKFRATYLSLGRKTLRNVDIPH